MKRNQSVQTVVAAFALVTVTTSGVVAAEETEAQLLTQGLVSKADAQKTAVEKVPDGRVESAELEKENGKLVWSFDYREAKHEKHYRDPG